MKYQISHRVESFIVENQYVFLILCAVIIIIIASILLSKYTQKNNQKISEKKKKMEFEKEIKVLPSFSDVGLKELKYKDKFKDMRRSKLYIAHSKQNDNKILHHIIKSPLCNEENDDCIERLITENKIMAYLKSSGLCGDGIIDYYGPGYFFDFIEGYEDPIEFIALALEHGGDTNLHHCLRDKLIAKNLSNPSNYIKIAKKLLKNVGRLHDAGVIHNDISASNIFLFSPTINKNILGFKKVDFGNCLDNIKLGDFDAAFVKKIHKPYHSFTYNFRYLAPERARAKIDEDKNSRGKDKRFINYFGTPQSDIYSIGILIAELYLGRLIAIDKLDKLKTKEDKVKYSAGGVLHMEFNLKSTDDDYSFFSKKFKGIWPWLQNMVEFNPEQRFENAWEALESLKKL